MKATTEADQRNRFRYWIVQGLRRVGDLLFARADAAAHERGWQITVRYHGLGRAYRDPRFDRLVTCRFCCGRGRIGRDETYCRPCRGTGRAVKPGLDPHGER